MENMAYEKGKVINADFVDYIVPSSFDIPHITSILVEPIESNGPYGAKGIAEPAFNPTMAAITNAIYNATGVRIKALPVNPHKLLSKIYKIGRHVKG
jgi:CO/xanthine dehydrogenase Mo-binding subunit